jgi:L-aspartate oxidase
MEFSGYYTMSPAHQTMTRSMSYLFGTYTDADGHEIEVASPPDLVPTIARALLRGPVYTVLDRMPQEYRDRMPSIQPNFMLGFNRLGIDPYRDRFEVTLRAEGTIRGTGGLRIVSDDCRTTVPGLFAAGDVATRELVAGATSGGGAQNSAWALSSGTWAGKAAVDHSRRPERTVSRAARPLGGAGLRPSGTTRTSDLRELQSLIRAEMTPYDKNLFRRPDTLSRSLEVLDGIWDEMQHVRAAPGENPVVGRETAAMTAMARWCYRAALERDESRGLHQRVDSVETKGELTHRLIVGGLDDVWTRPDHQPALAAASTGAPS